MVCDFCSCPDVAVAFTADDFVFAALEVDGITPASKGGWEACAECAAHVAVRDWNALARRAAESIAAKHHGELGDIADLQDFLFAVYAGMLDGHLTGSYSMEREIN